MEIHFQTTDHVVAVEKVAEQHNGTKYSKCNSLRVTSHITIPTHRRTDANLYPPERQLTKASEPSYDLEGGGQRSNLTSEDSQPTISSKLV